MSLPAGLATLLLPMHHMEELGYTQDTPQETEGDGNGLDEGVEDKGMVQNFAVNDEPVESDSTKPVKEMKDGNLALSPINCDCLHKVEHI